MHAHVCVCVCVQREGKGLAVNRTAACGMCLSHDYDCEGCNGCGKSTLFGLLSACGHDLSTCAGRGSRYPKPEK